MGRTELNTLWIGPQLSFLERACLRSALKWGHAVALYCYREPAGVPEGVELRDASELFPESAVITHRGGSPSLFSNRFRYELQRRSLGIWIDCDLYFIGPLGEQPKTIVGDQGGGVLAMGILRLPSDCPMLEPLAALFDERSVPPWLPWRAAIAAWWRLKTTGRSGLPDMPWGSAGPNALNWLARKHGWTQHAQPPSRFYPVHWTDADWLLDPGRPLETVIKADTIAVHLWNELIKRHDLTAAPAGSFAARLVAEGAL